ncbi:hypothetical protein [Pseudonocardia sp. H11422]|uniref:hypothetical protein n=1 Tax=Pseudonocardia sp. H11422 TaxID=2835866 RepID=UPI001BDD367E|nr:hypothetical protein [Pseudonocardia sp. H11422]
MARLGRRLEFAAPSELLASDDRAAVVLVPATNPTETDFLRAFRADRFMLPITGVVCDITGHQTYLAIRSGATAVVNLLVPAQQRMKALHAVLA